MSNQTELLIQLLSEQKTCNEICDILSISNKQLFNNLTNLRNKGFLYKEKYYANGDIVYKPIKSFSELSNYRKNPESAIITPHYQTKLTCLVISDLHFGNTLERLDLLNKVYDYCIVHGIHIIFCCGDIIDGAYSKGEQSIPDIHKQIEHFIHDYPFDKNILTFAVAGDHDLSALWNEYRDIIEITSNYRRDIIIGGYNNASVNIKNDSVSLFHHVPSGTASFDNSRIILAGHTHKYSASMIQNNALFISVPSLSDINQSLPTAIELTLQFKTGFIDIATIKQILLDIKPCILSEITFQNLKQQTVNSSISNEEEYKTMDSKENVVEDLKEEEIQPSTETPKIKTLGTKKERLSQIEKFNNRYGL